MVPVSAAYFYPMEYINSQKVMLISENLYVSGDTIIVNFRGRIGINPDLFNYTNKSVFEFVPVWCIQCESIYNYSDYVGLQTFNWKGGEAFSSDKHADYILQERNNTRIYTVNISDLKPTGIIVFEANYTLKGAIRKIDDTTYYVYYVS